MQPKTSKQLVKKLNSNVDKSDKLACKFPGLAIPNEAVSDARGEVHDSISDVMAELEAIAPVYNSKYVYTFT